MATYKLIQDIEAEDHILGPLSFRQFIFALIASFCSYMAFIGFAKNIIIVSLFFLPPALFFWFFAFPFGRDQPTEVWALAKLRFWFKPRKRIWNQSGVKDVVSITVPKKVEPILTNGLSQTEVKSRLQALANTIDSRGWAVKNVNVNSAMGPSATMLASDRLVDVNTMPQQVPEYDVLASDDILDEFSNPVAQQFEHMIDQSARDHRQQLIDRLNDVRAQEATKQAAPAPEQWFTNQLGAGVRAPQANSYQLPAPVGMNPAPAVQPSQNDMQLSGQLKAQNDAQQAALDNMHTLQSEATTPAATPSAEAANPAIISLARNNDLNVATLAREADKAHGEGKDGEVVIPLR